MGSVDTPSVSPQPNAALGAEWLEVPWTSTSRDLPSSMEESGKIFQRWNLKNWSETLMRTDRLLVAAVFLYLCAAYAYPGTAGHHRQIRPAAQRTLSVTSFGAVGDGKHDDSAAFAAAVESLNAGGGGVLHVPCGTYLVNTPQNNPRGRAPDCISADLIISRSSVGEPALSSRPRSCRLPPSNLKTERTSASRTFTCVRSM